MNLLIMLAAYTRAVANESMTDDEMRAHVYDLLSSVVVVPNDDYIVEFFDECTVLLRVTDDARLFMSTDELNYDELNYDYL